VTENHQLHGARAASRRDLLRLASTAAVVGGVTSLAGEAAPAQAAAGEVSLTPGTSAENTVVAQSSGVTPLTLRGASGQSANLQEWRDGVGTLLVRVDPIGRLKLIADGGDGGERSSLLLDNRTPGESATIFFNKDHLARWHVGIDGTPGPEGDFNLFHHGSGSQGGANVLYMTNEQYPKVSINGDRYTPGTFTLYNLTDRPALFVEGAQSQGTDIAQFKSGADAIPVFTIGSAGLFKLLNSTYTPGPSDAPTGGGFLYNRSGQLSWLSGDGSIVTLAPDWALPDGHNLTFGATTGTRLGTATAQKLSFFNANPVAQPTLSYSRSGAGETAAEARVRSALVALGLVADRTTA
jgi:hypothetical protein